MFSHSLTVPASYKGRKIAKPSPFCRAGTQKEPSPLCSICLLHLSSMRKSVFQQRPSPRCQPYNPAVAWRKRPGSDTILSPSWKFRRRAIVQHSHEQIIRHERKRVATSINQRLRPTAFRIEGFFSGFRTVPLHRTKGGFWTRAEFSYIFQ